jgi:hypothetical protein
MTMLTKNGTYHYMPDLESAIWSDKGFGPAGGLGLRIDEFTYTFTNFFHPFVGELIRELNRTSVRGMLDPKFLGKLDVPYDTGENGEYDATVAAGSFLSEVKLGFAHKAIDLSIDGPYANYNWELLYHIPVAVAVHLSNQQRFAEAERWFHLVFDPTCADTTVSPPERFWKFLKFREPSELQNIATALQWLSTPYGDLDDTQKKAKQSLLDSYQAILQSPFNPHAVARARQTPYQWYVVMKYLDNLIAWGDSLFLQDTIETINEATLCYVLAANILGPRPQDLPQRGLVRPKNYLQLKEARLKQDPPDPTGNALVELEGQFPFNLAPGSAGNGGSEDQSGPLFGIGRALYFCIPPNQTLLAYWDTVADRLFKIRNSLNIQGVVQQLPLFDPPLDPGMLVKAAAAGIDISSIVSGLNQPLGPVRSPLLIQKALEITGEVRSLGNALLASIEKGEAEQLALLRQGHEVKLQQLSQDVRFLQWRSAQESTKSLLTSRATALERLRYYQRLLGLSPDPKAPDTLPLDQSTDKDAPPKLTEENFDQVYDSLIGQHDKQLTHQDYPPLQLAGDSSPGILSGFSGSGKIYLSHNEDVELNTHLPAARDSRFVGSIISAAASAFLPVPDMDADIHFWGLGGKAKIKVGEALYLAGKTLAEVAQITSAWEQDQAGMASKYASYERRADEWLFQYNLAAHEVMQIGRQILTSLIAEQIALHEYQTVKTQVQQAQDIQTFLETKFTNAKDQENNPGFYDWQSSEITRLYYQYYRFAFDTARRAEQTMKRELMRPELDATQFIQFNYWDSGHKGLLSGEALYLDIKRMEMAYHDSNKRELELTRHVSLRQLDPLALLSLKITGSCTVTVPEWLYDLDCPGHYMRRIESVAVSVPCVAGPYTSINCTLSLQSSSVRISPLLKDGKYQRDLDSDDIRFVDYFGAADTIVTSAGANDSGMFETNLKDERFLPFEGAGAISTWILSLPAQLRTFDYMTISDVILHVRYTARQAGDPLGAEATKELLTMLDTKEQSSQALMFCLRYDFPTEWSTFINSTTADFSATLRKDHFPYLVQSAKLTIHALTLYIASDGQPAPVTPKVDPQALSDDLNKTGAAKLILPRDDRVMKGDDASQQVFILLQYHFGL